MPKTTDKTSVTKTTTSFENAEENTDTVTEQLNTTAADIANKLNMDEKITLRNIANWTVGFNKIESFGEVNINPNGSVRCSRAEVISQFENGNKLLRGFDTGEHATIYIDDKETRDYLDYKGALINKSFVEKLFAIQGLNDFKTEIEKHFITRAEKVMLIKLIRECKFNDFNKIRECEIYCGMNV